MVTNNTKLDASHVGFCVGVLVTIVVNMTGRLLNCLYRTLTTVTPFLMSCLKTLRGLLRLLAGLIVDMKT